MSEQKRCKKCNKPIDEGELCSGCRKLELKPDFRDANWLNPEYRRLMYQRGEDACKNARYETHHPEYFK